jgi:hypothetical protein
VPHTDENVAQFAAIVKGNSRLLTVSTMEKRKIDIAGGKNGKKGQPGAPGFRWEFDFSLQYLKVGALCCVLFARWERLLPMHNISTLIE